jgi:thioredoxin 1
MIEITEQEFDREVLECELPVFACFTTSWCHNCYPTCIFADQLVEEYDGRLKFVRLDTEKSPDIAEKYHVIAVPTILIFQNAREVNRLLGFQDKWSLKPLLNGVIDENESLIRESLRCKVSHDRVREIKEKIADLKARWPAHSVPPRMWQQLEELEAQLEEAKKRQQQNNNQ